MASSKLQIDEKTRQVICNGCVTVLQEKTWQVLDFLRRRSPAIVERGEIIDALWQGNWLTGEKGLNQAIWTLRQALGDDAKAPSFIRTIPRRGYQWVHVAAGDKTPARETSSRAFVLRLVAGLAFAAGGLALLAMRAAPLDDSAELPRQQRILHAYLVNRDIHVELESGCLGILKNANNADISEPVVSADGREVAVAVHEPEGCRLVTIDVTSGSKSDFGSCPAG